MCNREDTSRSKGLMWSTGAAKMVSRWFSQPFLVTVFNLVMHFYNHMFLGLAQPCYPLFISILLQLKKSKFLSQSSLGGNHFLRDKMNTKIITAKSSKTMHVEECVGLVNHWTCISISTGLLTSITLPCYYQGKFIGVVGTDISMEDLLSEITYFQRGQSSYAFMVDSSGRTMMHPLLPAPSDAFGDPIFMDITALEPEPEFTSVFLSIKR